MRIALLGLGLVGGSIARAVRPLGWHVAAWTPRGDGPRRALAAGVVDAAPATLGEAVAGAALVVLAAPPSACLDLLDALAGGGRGGAAGGGGGPPGPSLDPDAVVTDVASIKVSLVARAARNGLRFVGGHPMAGREASGFGAADAGLFRGRPWVLVPPVPDPADAAATARVAELAEACGALPLSMTAAAHDAAAAAISHAPLVVAAALVEAMAGGPGEPPPPGWADAAAIAAGGWTGATRLARGDPEMGAGIAAGNAGPLAARLRATSARLEEWISLLEAEGPGGRPDEAALRDRFAAARARLAADG